ncbi:MAG: amidohydrolase family protein, partial [Cyclobacteriaceae bacterium]|nr:amidohydrolase family protein [Cyclobacteriaceae bacterium]
KIAFGTDAGVFPHGDNAKEFGYMVEVGMKPMEAIQSATIVAAQLLRVDDTLGSIEKGKIADLVATDKNPLQNIHATEKVSFVMKSGVVYKNE